MAFVAVLDVLYWCLRILWAVRVSVIYGVAGVFLFGTEIPAQNLFADLSSMNSRFAEVLFWLGVFAFTFWLWAFPIHYGARHTLAEDSWILPRALRDDLSARCVDQVVAPVRERFHLVLLWLPRLLGLLPFVAIALGIHGALSAIKAAGALSVSELTLTQGHALYACDALTAAAFLIFVLFRRPILDRLDVQGHAIRLGAIVATTAIFVFCYLTPIKASVIFPRALLVPPLFGSLVLLFSLLQRMGNRTGFPFLLTWFVVIGVLTGFNASFNALRLVPGTADERLTVGDALAQWKRANGCETGGCPRPMVIAIDGGASRAAFTAATFVGELLDRLAASDKTGLPGRRIFAISGVSGGAYGAAVIQAALADAQANGGGAPPCRSAQTTWFGYGAWAASGPEGGRHFTWRQCLQALTSGDYLSGTIVGLGFRDFFAPAWQDIPLLHLPAMRDRAGLLETAWEKQYSATLSPDLHFFEHGSACDDPAATGGLCRRAAHPAAFLGKDPHRWMPMLLLNATSVATGRRVISSDLRARHAEHGQSAGALYPEAYDLREAMADVCPDPPRPTTLATSDVVRHLDEIGTTGHNERTGHLGICGVEAPVVGPDVRLSTAALTSARFPVVSPAGAFSMRGSPYGDLLVDGGYFENSGLTTALDIVDAIKDADPILVSIANDPEIAPLTDAEIANCTTAQGSPIGCTGLPRRPTTTPLVPLADTSLIGRIFGVISRPLQTILSTRAGHAAEAQGKAEAAFPESGGFFRLKVDVAPDFSELLAAGQDDATGCTDFKNKHLTMAQVSMSWWLSASVQADLDAQRCSNDNRTVLRDLIGASRLEARPAAPAPKPP